KQKFKHSHSKCMQRCIVVRSNDLCPLLKPPPMRLPTSTIKSLEGEGPNTPLQPFTRCSLTLQNFYK
ncbi:unnamed protein product, partial [Musa textilis]